MDWGIFLRRPSGPRDADRTYTLVATQVDEALADLPDRPAFLPWEQVFDRATKDPQAVAAVQAFGERVRAGQPLTEPGAAADDLTVDAAVSKAYDFSTRVVGLKQVPASLAAGWCWLQWIEHT